MALNVLTDARSQHSITPLLIYNALIALKVKYIQIMQPMGVNWFDVGGLDQSAQLYARVNKPSCAALTSSGHRDLIST